MNTFTSVEVNTAKLQVPDENVEATYLRVGAGGEGRQGHVRRAAEA